MSESGGGGGGVCPPRTLRRTCLDVQRRPEEALLVGHDERHAVPVPALKLPLVLPSLVCEVPVPQPNQFAPAHILAQRRMRRRQRGGGPAEEVREEVAGLSALLYLHFAQSRHTFTNQKSAACNKAMATKLMTKEPLPNKPQKRYVRRPATWFAKQDKGSGERPTA
jgi:hypothetical protein